MIQLKNPTIAGDMLSHWLWEHRVSQSEFARQLGWSPAKVCRFIEGTRRPQLEDVPGLEEFTDIPAGSWALAMANIEPSAFVEEICNEFIGHAISLASRGFTIGMPTRTIIVDEEMHR